MLRDLNEAFGEIHIEISEIRDLGDRLVAIGRSAHVARRSGVETETPLALVTEVRNGKTISVRGYLDPKRGPRSRGAVGARRSRRLLSLRDTARAMSQENVEIVRRFFEAGQRSLEAYWKNPRSGAAALEAGDMDLEQEEVLAFLHPEVEVYTRGIACRVACPRPSRLGSHVG